MANLKISNLQPAGYDLFSDSESYMTNLSEDELNTTHGGFSIAGIILHIVGEAVQIGTKFNPKKVDHRRDDRGPVSWVP